MKKILKKMGRIFVILTQKYDQDLRESVLLVDGSFILPNNFALIIKKVKDKFKNAKLTVLTFEDKKEFLKENFPDLEIIVSGGGANSSKHRLARKLFLLLHSGFKFKFIILSSLDISTVFVSIFSATCPIFLHNRWFEWYKIRQRTLGDILRGARGADVNRRRTDINFKEKIKSLGRGFVILTSVNEADTKQPVLVVDNGYTDIGHVSTAPRLVIENFLNPDVTILTFSKRKHYFENMFPQAKIIVTDESANRYALALEIYRLRKQVFSRVVLTTLDISPIIVSFLLMKPQVWLYNKWHQWWSLEIKDVDAYAKSALISFVMLPVFLYLLFAAALILIKTRFRLWLIGLKILRVNSYGY